MNPLSAVVSMPAWVFFGVLGALLLWNVYLMWANSTQREDNQRLVHRIQRHVKDQGGTVSDLSRLLGRGDQS